MLRADIQWLDKGPILRMAGKLVGDWAEQARNLVTKDVVPKGLMIDLTEVSYIDPVGEEFLKWLASVGAVVVAGNVYAMAVCERLRLLPVQRRVERHKRRQRNDDERSLVRHSVPVEAI